ncbi:DMT family transporter [Streptomyces olivaceiscleroticus]|uniref:DMT family transporter n=1 Tax=Streptomyces olivaceiscleroticus TaxID=68245 RepID=A0ABN0ZFC0_9ACTN
MLSYLLAVLAACANAAASVLQRRASRDLPSEDSLRPRLILHLLSRPVWFAGFLCVILGFVLQAAALATGSLSVVQPILVVELPVTLLLASFVFHARLHRREWLSIVGMTVGLAALLYFLSPAAGAGEEAGWPAWTVGVTANLLIVVAAVEWGRRAAPARPGGGSRRAGAFGVAAGCQFGLTAAFMKGAMSHGEEGVGAVLATWQLYAMVAAGILAMFLLQSALHAGNLLAAQPGLTLSDPIVAILWGSFAFAEQVRGGWYVVPAVAGGALMACSAVVLTRSPLLKGEEALIEADRMTPAAGSPSPPR